MKFTVEVEDFYLEEGELGAELQHQIKTSVVRQISENIKKQVDAFVEKHVLTEINKELETRVKLLVDQFIQNNKVKGKYSSDPERTLEQWISDQIHSQRADLQKTIESLTKKHVDAMRNQYDVLFATQIVRKMSDQGFLKADVASMLLNPDHGTDR